MNNLNKLQYHLFCLGLFTSFVLPVNLVYGAASFSASPLLIDHNTEGRDIISETITLINSEDRNLRVYASVNEVKTEGEDKIMEFIPGSMSERTTSITSWIEITRARLEIPARGKLEVPVTIRIHPNAPAGTYQAYVGFASGANRDEIEKKIIAGAGTGAIVKITIDENLREQLSLVNFNTDRFVWNDNPQSQLSYQLENSGDVPLIPKGEIIIYNNRGEELTTVKVNKEGESIQPGERVKFTEHLPFIEKLSKNKAYLSIQYGDKQQAAVFDTAFYYSVPWYYLVIIFTFLLGSLVTIAYVFKRAYSKKDDAFDGGVYDIPMFVKGSRNHQEYDHDINLKNEKQVQ